MTIRRKTLLIVAATVAAMLLGIYAVSQLIVMRGFTESEREETRRGVQRVLNALAADLSSLDSLAYDWASWDDTYAFIEDENQTYVRSNLLDGTLANLRLSFMIYAHSSGRIVRTMAYDLSAGKPAIVPESLWPHLSPEGLVIRASNRGEKLSGLLSLPEGAALVASRPILTSEDEGPARGALLFGRFLDAAEIQRLAETTREVLSAQPADDSRVPPDLRPARFLPSENGAIVVQALSAETVAGYTLLEDLYGTPALVLRVERPRTHYEQGRTTVRYFMFSLITLGLVFGGVVILLLDRAVLSRLAVLRASFERVGATGVLKERLSLRGKDELAELAAGFNRMLERLEESQRKLQQYQSRQVSLAEELERRRIATDLHDGPIQTLGLSSMKLGALREAVASTAHGTSVDEIRQQVQDALQQIRSLVFELSPPVLHELGLPEALDWLAERVQEMHGLVCDVEVDPRTPIPGDEMRLFLFQAVRELLRNVTKHARATRAKVLLEAAGEGIRARVEDDGAGFDPARLGGSPPGTGAFGLFSLTERVNLLGGRLEIQTEPGRGTRVTLTVPTTPRRKGGDDE